MPYAYHVVWFNEITKKIFYEFELFLHPMAHVNESKSYFSLNSQMVLFYDLGENVHS